MLNPTPANYQLWKAAQRDYELTLVNKTQKRLLYQSQIFESGDRNGRLLAFLAKHISDPITIASIYDHNAVLYSSQEGIMDSFLHFTPPFSAGSH